MADQSQAPWWHGTNYEIMDWIEEPTEGSRLQAAFTPNNGIRITIENDDLGGLATFDFTEAQARLIGAKLIVWAERGHGD